MPATAAMGSSTQYAGARPAAAIAPAKSVIPVRSTRRAPKRSTRKPATVCISPDTQ